MNNKSHHSSLERLYPEDQNENEKIAGSDTLQLHLERYHYAGKNLVPGRIADIACGAGYGTYLLANEYKDKVQQLTGVDNDAEAIAYANDHYKHHKITFQLADAFTFQSTELLNTIISLETIEHLDEPAKFVQHLVGQLAPGGRFIASAPVTPSMDANPFHKQDFTTSSFRKLFSDQGMKEICSFMQTQSYGPFKLMNKKTNRERSLRKNILGYYFTHPSKFFLRIRSLFKDGFSNKYLVVVFEKS